MSRGGLPGLGMMRLTQHSVTTGPQRVLRLGNRVDMGHAGVMTTLVLAMLLCLGLAVTVVLLVAVPARRAGRDVLTPRGEEVVDSFREAADAARSRFERTPDENGPKASGADQDGLREPAGQAG